jgi:hypothetical protein
MHWYKIAQNQQEIETAAKKAGYNSPIVYHGTYHQFTIFNKEKLGSKNIFAESANEGFFFGGNKTTAENYTHLTTMDLAMLNLKKDPILMQVYQEFKTDADKIELEKKTITNKVYNELNAKTQSSDEMNKILEIYKKYNVEINEAIMGELRNMFANKFYGHDLWEEIDKRIKERKIYEQEDAIKSKALSTFEERYNKSTGRNPSVMPVYLSLTNPYVHDYKGLENDRGTEGLTSHIKKAKSKGFDSVIFKNLADGGDIDTIYVVFEPNQIKSAELITYDDNGTEIPLNNRFIKNNNDIRW